VDCQILNQNQIVIMPFDDLELTEAAGVYMGAGLKPPTYQDGYMQGLENEIKVGYVSSAPSDPQLEYIKQLVESMSTLLNAVASRVGIYDDRNICRCKCNSTPPQKESKEDNHIVEEFDNGEYDF